MKSRLITAVKGSFTCAMRVPHHLVTEAAQSCIDASACRYTYFKKALNRMLNQRSVSSEASGKLPEHENIRGRECYG